MKKVFKRSTAVLTACLVVLLAAIVFFLKSSYTNILVPDEKTAVSIAMSYPKWKIAVDHVDQYKITAVCKNDEWIVSFTSKYQPTDMLGGGGLEYIINRKTGVVEDCYRMK